MTAEEALHPVTARLTAIMRLAPTLPALLLDDDEWTWGDADQHGQALADVLSSTGIASGVPVSVVARNRPGSIATLLGLLTHGWPPALVSPIQPPAGVAATVRSLNADVVAADERDWGADLTAAVTAAGAAGLAFSDEPGQLRLVVSPAPGATGLRVGPSTAFVVPTSGTTGHPKHIELPGDWLPVDLRTPPRRPEDLSVRPPVIHTLSTATITGVRGVIQTIGSSRALALMERLEVVRWAALVAKYRPRRAGLPPAAMRSLLDAGVPAGELSSLEAWRTGSAPLDPALQEEFERYFGVPVLVAYGATEFGGPVASWSLEDHRQWAEAKRGSVGRAARGARLRVVDQADGRPLTAGQQGLLEVRLATAEDGSSWQRTNDLARIDGDGFLFIDGRADDVLIRGGFKVPLGEVRDVFATHPAVNYAEAVDLPDDRLGQVPAVAVVLREGTTATPDELDRWARERIAPYKVPRVVAVLDALPLGPSLKVDRRALRSLLQARQQAGPPPT